VIIDRLNHDNDETFTVGGKLLHTLTIRSTQKFIRMLSLRDVNS